eukprot:TRINITY_DN9409_c0_g1_i2.p1 TRINITY_DN9409_c0_g1~~TRINITY_DN9409_c0_g1_i2.p1  ORF type:complete len:578 (+),score=130.46 TRINITY_DN9409_c0_g1_i2:164-1897(+)
MTGIDMFMKQNGIQTSTAAESPSSWEENSGKSALGWLADRTQPRQMTPSPPPKEEFNVVDLLRSSDRQPMPPNEPPPPTPPPPHDKPPTALSRSQSLHAYSDSAPHVMPMQHSNSVQNLFKINQKGESTPPQRSSPTSRGDPQQQQQQVVQQQVQQQVQQPMWILPGLNVGQMSSMVMPTFVQSLPVGIPQVQQVQASHIPTPPTEPPPPEPPVPPEAPPPPVPEPPTVPPPPQEAPPVEPVPPVSAIQKPTPPQQPQVQKPVPSQQPPQQLPRVEKPAEKPRPEPPAPRAPEPPMADVEPLAVFQVDPPPEQPAVSLSLARFGLATDKLARARCELSVRVGCFAIASNSLCEVEEIQSGRAVLRSIHGNYWMERPLSTVRPARLIVLNPANSLFSSPNSKSLKSFITFLRTSAAIATKSATDDFLADTVFKFDGEYASVWDSHPEWSETNTLFLEEAEDSVQGCLPNAVIIPPTQGFSKDEELFKELRGIIEKLLTTTEDTRSFIEDHVTGNWKQVCYSLQKKYHFTAFSEIRRWGETKIKNRDHGHQRRSKTNLPVMRRGTMNSFELTALRRVLR